MLNNHNSKEAQEGVIEISDFTFDVLYEMIRYMYCDEVLKVDETVLDLLHAGNKYDLPGLVNITQFHLLKNITLDNFTGVVSVADALNLTELKVAAINFIVNNHETILKSPSWKSFKENNLQLYAGIMEDCFVLSQEKLKK